MADSIADQMKLDYMRRSMFSGAKVQPDAEAKAQLLAQKTGLPVDVVREKQPEIEAEDKLNSIDYDGLARKSPKLSTWLIDKSNAAVAHDDLEGLSTIENLISGMGQRTANIASGFYRFVGTTTAPIAEQIEKAIPFGTIDVGADGIKWRPSRPEDFSGAGALRSTVGFYGQAAEESKYQPGTTWEQVKQSPLSEFFPFALEQGIVSIPDMVAAVTMLPSYIAARSGEMGQTRAENDMRQEATVGDLFTVMPFAVASSAMERFGAKGIIGLDEVALTSLKQVPKAVGVAATKEGITEAGQEGIESIAETAYTERGFNLSETGERMLAGAVGGAPFGGFVRGLEGSIEASVNMRKAKQNEQFFQALGDESQKVKLKDRLPDRYRELIDRYTADGPVKEILIPADKFAEYYQSAGIDPAVAAQKAGARNFAEAFASGGDVVVPMSGFMSQIAPSDDLQGLMEDLRLFAGEPTMREAKEAQANMPEIEETLQAEAEKINEAAKQADSLDVAIQRVVSDVEGQLSTRYDINTAKNMATVMRGIAVLANRAYPNMNPLEASQRMWAKYGLDIQANPLPDVLRDPRNYDVTLDPMLDRLRKGEVPAQSDMYGQSLIEFLREKGGLRDLGGELAARDMDLWDKQNRKKGQKKLVNAKGLDLDHAREIALEAGYEVGADLNTFYAALDKELAGESVFSTANYDNAAIAQGSSLAELDRALQELGLDLNSMDNESIKKALRGGQTYNAKGTKQFGMAEGEQWDEGEDVPKSFRKQEGLTPEVTEEFDPAMLKFQAFQSAFHGSPFRFDKFTLDHIGKGEGAQAFGWGLYFAGDKQVAEYYRERLSSNQGDFKPAFFVGNSRIEPTPAIRAVISYMDGKRTQAEASDIAKRMYPNLISEIDALPNGLRYGNEAGQLYEVNIPEDDTMLLWDKPLSEQSKTVQDALSKFDPDMYSKDGQDYDASETGQSIYLRIADKFRKPEPAPNWTQAFVDTDEHAWSGQEAASKYLNSLGITGIKYLDGSSRASGEGNYNYVIFDDSAIEILKTYYQNENEKFGSFQIGENRKMRINLFENANLSTFIHESGHFYLEVLGDLANDPDASQQVKDDYAKILKFMGVENRADIKVEHHEKFARANEAYMFEGKAPAVELRGVFQRFRAWMKIIYRQLTSLNVKLTDEVREVFDRIYATDAEIERARSEMDTDTVVDAKTLGMTDAEFELYRNAVDSQIGEAKEDLQAKLMKVQKLKTEAWWKDELKKMADEVAAEYDALPAAQAFERMSAKDSAERLNKQQLIERYGSDFLKKLPRGYKDGKGAIYSDEGNDLDLTAEIMGFQSGDEMLTAMIKLPNRARYIAAEADQRMMKKHGDLLNDVALADEAMAAMHNEQRAKVIKIEMRAINKKIREVKPFVKAEQDKAKAELKQEKKERDYERRFLDAEKRTEEARRKAAAMAATSPGAADITQRMAQGIISQKQIRDLNPNQYLVAERKANRAAFKAMAKGDYVEAGLKKQQELLNHYLYLEARKAKDKAEKIQRKWSEFANRSDKKLGKSYDIDLVNSVRAVLGEFGIAPRMANKASEYLKSVERYDPELFKIIDQSVKLAEANSKPFKELSVDELLALNDEIESMIHLAKRSHQSEVDGRLLDIQDIEDDLMSRMTDYGIPDKAPGEGQAVTPGEQRMTKIKSLVAFARRVESWSGMMDGNDQIGPFRRYIWNRISDAAVKYRTDKGKYIKQYRDLIKTIAPSLKPQIIEAPELNYTFGKDSGGSAINEIVHAILHTGNDSNKRKLLLGRGWADELSDGSIDTTRWDRFINRMAIEGKITKAHFDFAQGVWDMLESTKEQAQKTHRDVFGKYFDEVTAKEFQTPFGTYRGGYVPAMVDSRIVKDAALRAMADQDNAAMSYAFPTAPKGFTKARVEYNKPLMLDLRTLAQHLDKVLLFSHMEMPARDVHRIMSKRVGETINKIDPTAIPAMLTPWLNRATKQQVETPVPGDFGTMRFFSVLRSRAGMAAMFANLANTAQQITGFSLASIKVKPKLLVEATADYIKSPKEFTASVAAASPYMATRMENEVAVMNGEINEILMNPSLLEKGQAWGMRHAYFMQAAVDNVMSPIIWTAAYNQAVSKGADHPDAVRIADSAVRETQGSMQPEDISRIESGNAFVRMFTQFAGYFNMNANLLGTGFAKLMHDGGLRKNAGKGLYLYTFGLLMPAVIGELIIQAFRGGPDDEDKDGEYLDDWIAAVIGWAQLRYVTAMVPVAGQSVNAIVNAGNKKPYDDRLATSPAISMLESAARAPWSVYNAATGDASAQKAVRDVATLVTMALGLPATGAARPVGYATGVADDKINPTGPIDYARGMVTGFASPQGK